jgi:hypothetical protein
MPALGVVLATLLTAYLIWLVVPHDGGSVADGLAAVTMTAPIAFAARAPSAAALTLAAAAAANDVFFGHLVRCGAALPATFFVAFVCGRVLSRRSWPGLAGTLASIAIQCVFDPRLGASAIALMVPLDIVFFCAGAYVRRRADRVESLRAYTVQLHEQREETARLAVAADRQELTDRLSLTLRQRIEAITQAAAASGSSHERFATIELFGRETLEGMRELVGSLGESPTEPEPGLADLAELCARATTAEVTLTVNGEVRALPASIELSACRIVEQLLRVLPDQPAARVQLRLDFAITGLDIAMSGGSTNGGDVHQVQALASARAALHGGSVVISDRSGQTQAQVHLPLVSSNG